MELYERLYDETERVNVRFVGVTTDKSRYDFGMMYTNMFFGKPLVTCMQTGRSFLMCAEDAKDVEQLQRVFKISDHQEAESLSEFFMETLPHMSVEPQY
ncbi:DUF3055 domain-containing protein [Evansella cellulosilytica]|uniref:DUF3055 domain-containing protein n=1 Tax=Evansella cellulosilytica (strain ATCC 21833 / DSM 2522 / FERM P-1141 / JCM 9156 / N-4) TaxID=649639 RepID=E6TUM4_EVAC2|nr:DUF3055 domain-containing protein [Evansella cellulosilytica]ADU30914.1 hypothetical protein Bcell_2659 [Evansella cellulosilytica DSM 2522]